MQVRRSLITTGLTVAVTAAVTATLTTSVGASATPAALPAAAAPAAAAAAPAGHVPDPTTATLRQLARHTKLRIGTAVDTDALANDATYRRMVAEQFSTVTPENVMKWEVVEPERGQYDFTAADQLVRFARAHGQKVRGHTLVWHNQLPAGSPPALDAGPAARHSQAAHLHRDEALPRADLGLGRRQRGVQRRRHPARRLLVAEPRPGLHRRRLPLGAPGRPEGDSVLQRLQHRGSQRQEHRGLRPRQAPARPGRPDPGRRRPGAPDTQYPFPNDMLQNLRRFGALGVDTAVTEADVRSVLPVDPAEVNAQAQGFSLMLQSCLLVRSCISYTLWGFTDKYNWVPGVFKGEGYATPFDENFNPKPAYDTMRRDLALAPSLRSRG